MKLKEIINEASTRVVDVRTKKEYENGHLQNAINIPLNVIQANMESIKNLNAKAVIFYCRSGSRSGQAVNYLKQLGLSNVYNGGSISEMNYLLN